MMKPFILGGLIAAAFFTVALAQPVSFRSVPPTLAEHPAQAVFEAKAALADDEVLVVREVKKSGDGGLRLSDSIYSAYGMDASYRVVRSPVDHRGTTIKFLGVNDSVREPTSRTTLTDTRLEMEFFDPATGAKTIYAWFAKVEKIADVQLRHPRYTPMKKLAIGAGSSGSRFTVSWRPGTQESPKAPAKP